MGDRCLVVFTNTKRDEISPVIYLHWHGHKVADWLKEWRSYMEGRMGDVQYGAARFVGICHTHIEGNLSLGIWQGGNEALADPEGYSHGDHGVVIVNADDGTFTQHGQACDLEGRANA